ncbi:MAG: permease-like cell division protein FtsX [Acutalibacteraceae bacterium]|nr:permease-like cell division protein FtsX [Acutalibacteraceae bacterium]
MKLSSMRYLTKEGIKNIWVNRLMTIASIGVLVACMVLIGLAMLISFNVDLALGNLEKQNVVMVFFNDKNSVIYADENPVDADKVTDDMYLIHNEQEAREVIAEIEKIANVEKGVEYISKEKALENLKESVLAGKEQYFDFLDEEGGNPLSDGAKITLSSMENFEKTVEKISKVKGIDSVQSQADIAKTINSIKSGVSVAGTWIIAILLVISLVIVSNTIRVTMYNRKLQISIMKAVGATDAFIRIPFVVEGIVIGIISALLSECVVYFCYRLAIDTIMGTLGTTQIVEFGDVAWLLLGIFAIIGVIAGIIGSVVMIGKYLRKEGSEFSAI